MFHFRILAGVCLHFPYTISVQPRRVGSQQRRVEGAGARGILSPCEASDRLVDAVVSRGFQHRIQLLLFGLRGMSYRARKLNGLVAAYSRVTQQHTNAETLDFITESGK